MNSRQCFLFVLGVRLTFQFSFRLGVLMVALWLPLLVTSSFAGDLGFALVVKGQEFAQTSANNVSLGEWNIWYQTGEVQNEGEHEESVFMFEAFGLETAPEALLNGTITGPGGDSFQLGRGEDQEDPEVGLESGADSPLALDLLWPDGDYSFTFTGVVDGAIAPVTLSLTGSIYPPVPQVTNFPALQSVLAGADTTVTWAPMNGGVEDFILLRIVSRGGDNQGETIYQSGLPGTAKALNGTATETVIPANTLEPGQDYQGEVLFFNVVDTQVGSALYVAAYYKLTGFLIRTASQPGVPLGAEFWRANPMNDTDWISRDAVVAFHFSHPMSPEYISISWTEDGGPLNTGSFAYQWTNDNMVLLSVFSTTLPANSEIGWTLNLGGFKDALGYALGGSTTGRFRTSSEEPESPPDLELIELIKARYYIQTDASPLPDGRYEASIEVEAMAANRLKSATITSLTDGRSSPLYADPWSGDEYEAAGEYGAKLDLDRFYPNGDYQFAFEGIGDGAQLITLSLGETDQYPDAPTITNIAALQQVDPAASATIQWNALPGWSSQPELGGGWMEFEILDEFDHEVFWLEGSDIVGGTECQIPPGTLESGRSYTALLTFVRITDWEENLYSGVMGVAGFESSTQFTITAAGQVDLPSVQLEQMGTVAQLNFSDLLDNRCYALDVSSDLKRWTPLTGIWNGYPQFEDFDAGYLKSRFYRLRECTYDEDLTPRIAIQGTVWQDYAKTAPAAGAVVGTSLDEQVTVTDARGTFFLVTDTPAQNGGANYAIEVSSGSQSRSFGPYQWGDQPRQQEFIMVYKIP